MHPVEMNDAYLYQQDTTKVKKTLETIPEEGERGGLRIERKALAPLQPIRTRDELRAEMDSATDSVAPERVQSQQPTMAQIRYWQWQREQDIKVGDSRFIPPREEINLVTSKSLKNPGLVLPTHELNRVNNDWLTIILLLSLILFASVRSVWSKYMLNLFQSAVNYPTANRMFREENYSVAHGAFRLDIYFYLVFSVFLFQVANYFKIDFGFSSFRLFVICVAGTFAFFTIKKILYKIVGFLFENPTETKEYLFNHDNLNRIAGILLFPVVILITFFPFSSLTFLYYIGIFAVIAVYFLLLFRGSIILLRKQFSIIYLFLYFCTLEILPLVLVYKILVV